MLQPLSKMRALVVNGYLGSVQVITIPALSLQPLRLGREIVCGRASMLSSQTTLRHYSQPT